MIRGSYENLILSTDPLICMPIRDDDTTAQEIVRTWNGSHTGITPRNAAFLNGDKIGYYDGIADTTDGYTTGFRDSFNPNLFTIMVWLKADNAGMWSDGATYVANVIGAYAQDFLWIVKNSANDLVFTLRIDNANKCYLAKAGATIAHTNWFCVFVTVDTGASDDASLYYNNAFVDNNTTLDVWDYALGAGDFTIGSAETGNDPWDGNLGYYTWWNRILTSTERGILYNGVL